MGFLETYDKLRLPEEKNALLLEWITRRRNELFTELRAQRPILAFPGPAQDTHHAVIVSRYKDVVEVIRDEHFNVAPYREAGSNDFILGMDKGPAHDGGRVFLEQVVRPTDRETIRAIVAEEAKVVTDAALPQGSLNLPDDFARPISLRLVARYFGVPGPDAQSLGNWTFALARAFTCKIFTHYFTQDPAVEAAVEEDALRAEQEFGAYVRRLVAAGVPREDTVSGRMLTLQRNSATPPTSQDIAHIVRLLIGTINGMIQNINAAVNKAMNILLSRPDALARAIVAAQANNEQLLGQYIWEALRFDTPAPPFLLRDCCEDYVAAKGTNNETAIPQGTRVFAAICSAMMDEMQVDHPEEFRPGRPDDPYLHFGAGLHECLGKHVAEVQLVEMVKSLLLLPGIRRARGTAGELQYEGLLPTSFTVAFDRQPYTIATQGGTMSQQPTSSRLVQKPLTAIMTIKSPEDSQALMKLLQVVQPRIAEALTAVGTVHFARFLFLDNNTKFAIITTYDESFEKYMNDFIDKVGGLFNQMLAHIKDAPPLPVEEHRDEFVEYVRRVDVTPAAPFYSAYPDLTVQSILFQKGHADS